MSRVTIQLSQEAKDLLARMPALPDRAVQALATELDRQNEQTIGYAQENKLSGSGPGTLGVRTGRLRRSYRRNNAAVSGRVVTGGIGSNVAYAGIHEYGFDGTESVGAFTRRNRARNLYEGKKKTLSASGVSYVRAFTRHMRMPARAPIGSSIEERLPKIGAGLSKAIVNALEGA